MEERAARVRAFESAMAAWRAGGAVPAGDVDAAVLVEGTSDRAAVLAAAETTGADLAGAGVAVIPMGGAMSVGRYVRLLGPLGIPLRALCDRAEAGLFARAGMRPDQVGICDPDLEGELIRALGVERVERVLAQEGDLRLFRTFQQQPAQRGRTAAMQLHRFCGTTSGRKERYARILTLALPVDLIPPPLRDLIEAVRR